MKQVQRHNTTASNFLLAEFHHSASAEINHPGGAAVCCASRKVIIKNYASIMSVIFIPHCLHHFSWVVRSLCWQGVTWKCHREAMLGYDTNIYNPRWRSWTVIDPFSYILSIMHPTTEVSNQDFRGFSTSTDAMCCIHVYKLRK